jgi:hypothetical protein
MRTTLIFFLFLNVCFSQNNVSLFTSNGSLFTVVIKDKIINATPQANVIVENVTEDTLMLKIELENNKKFESTIYLLEKKQPVKHKEFDYAIEIDKEKIKLNYLGTYDIKNIREPIVAKKPVVDTSQKYRNKTLGHLCEIKENKPVYFNNIPRDRKCTTAMPDEYLGYVAILMLKAEVQDHKYAIIENVLRNNCVSVAQTNTLLNYIDYEIEKLKLIRIGYFNLADPANQKNLENNFRFESSVKELNSFLKNSGDYKLKTSSTCTKASEQNFITDFSEKLSAYANDSQRLEAFKKIYPEYCYSIEHVQQILQKFLHDREKLEAAKQLFFNCVEKNNFLSVSGVFSYNQTASELKDFVEKQNN